MRNLVAVSLCLLATSLLAEELPTHEGSKELKLIKGLVGTWTGEMDHGSGPEKVTLVYRVTAGGSAVVETFNPGSPMEMVTVYHDRHGKLQLTHYCMLGNQPLMQLTDSSDNTISLKLAKKNSGVEAEAMYMSALTIKFDSANKIKQTWSMSNGGKEQQGPTVELTRKP